MKRLIIFLPLILLSWQRQPEEKKAVLTFTEQQYIAVQQDLLIAFKIIDSVKIAISYMDNSTRIQQSIAQAQANIKEVNSFIFQIDSVFKKVKK